MVLEIGMKVEKPGGYPFPGTVVAAFKTLAGQDRVVVESEAAPGLLHIFALNQLIYVGKENTREDG
jgi:hypothetical protein